MADVYKQSFKQNYTNNIELSIFNCGIERCAPGQTWGPGIRDHYLIHLVLSGKGVFEVGGRTWEVSPGDLFFARPSQLIRYTADEQQPWEYSWVGFNGACAHKLTAQLPFTDDSPVHHTQDPEGMRTALANIYSSRGLQPQDEAAMVGYLYLFIASLMKETSVGKPHTASSSSQYVLNAIKYIQFNYSHDISIDDVAKSVGVSRSHLYRVFMLNVGKSPIDYLTEYRINEACKLLPVLFFAGIQACQGRAAQQVFCGTGRCPCRRHRPPVKETLHALTEKSSSYSAGGAPVQRWQRCRPQPGG